jgi:hypothetical protein
MMQRIAAIVAAVLLLLSLVWWALSDPEVASPGTPRFTGGPLSRLEATQPRIAPFEHFYVNDDNPFVPFKQREDERIARRPRGVARTTVTPPPPPATIPPPRPPIQVLAPPPRAALVLPKLTVAGPTAPICVGLVNVDGKEALMARMPGAEAATPMAVGEEVGGWKLIAIENGNQARFTDAAGTEHVYPIGEGDLAMVQASAADPAPMPKPAIKPGILPKLPVGPRPLPPGGMPPSAKPGVAQPPKPGQSSPEQQPKRRKPPVQPPP